MNRGRNGEIRNVNIALETINAAANAFASAESRISPPNIQKRRWTGCWSVYSCFGSQKTNKRYSHAVLVPEPLPQPPNRPVSTPTTEPPSQPPSLRIPFAAPPSSPASFLTSEPQSAIHSPAGSVGMNSISASMYSPGGPRSIFAIGPYAHETQLVTPPVFSTYTTEPSTAPFTPPPESLHLTTPSSPEVPFAQLLDPVLHQRYTSPNYDFHSYLLHPGSPVGPLISPGSGTASPFPDHHVHGIPPRLLTLDADHRVSFELTSEDVVRCVEKKPPAWSRAQADVAEISNRAHMNGDDGQRHQRQRAASLGSIKEFHFDHIDEVDPPERQCVNSSWWANEKVVGREDEDYDGACKNWSFFPVMQPGVS